MKEQIKESLISFLSRKLFFSLIVLVMSGGLLFLDKLESNAFEMITISVVAAYLTSNVATKYTVTKNGFVADPSSDSSIDEVDEDHPLTNTPRGFIRSK